MVVNQPGKRPSGIVVFFAIRGVVIAAVDQAMVFGTAPLSGVGSTGFANVNLFDQRLFKVFVNVVTALCYVSRVIFLQSFGDVTSDASPIGRAGKVDFGCDVGVGIVTVKVGVLGAVSADVFFQFCKRSIITVYRGVNYGFHARRVLCIYDVILFILLYAANRIGRVRINFVLQSVREIAVLHIAVI